MVSIGVRNYVKLNQCTEDKLISSCRGRRETRRLGQGPSFARAPVTLNGIRPASRCRVPATDGWAHISPRARRTEDNERVRRGHMIKAQAGGWQRRTLRCCTLRSWGQSCMCGKTRSCTQHPSWVMHKGCLPCRWNGKK